MNGIQRLNEAKSKANQFIKQLDQLNDAQESAIKQQIDASDNIKDIVSLVNFNDAMNNLKDIIDHLDQLTKDSINYQNANEDLKLQFDHAINLANNVLNKKDGLNLDINVINGMAQATTDLAQRKRDAIQNNPDLTASQKAHALTEIDKAEKSTATHCKCRFN